MISIDDIVTQLQSTTTYTIEVSRAVQPNLSALSNLPIIYIGYGTIINPYTQEYEKTGILDFHGESLLQTIDQHICCEEADFRTVWINTFKGLLGFNPVAGEKYRTAMILEQGAMMGIENSRYWWLNRWRLSFNTMNVDI